MLLGITFLLQSCNDFLEQEPGTQVSINEQLGTKKGVLQALNGLYYEIGENVRIEAFVVYADVQGGNIKFAPSVITSAKVGSVSVPDKIENVYSFDDQSDDSDLVGFYNTSYDIINQANLILEFTDALQDATDGEKKQIKAEALTARAYSHFLLTEIYSQNYDFTDDASHLGIIYNNKSINNGLQYPSRETVADTYTFIINDLKNAINFYGDTVLLNGPDYSYFNKTNAKALLARVYLSKQDWKNAYELADDVITNSGISLISSSNYIAEWDKPDTPVSEILLEFSIPKNDVGVASASLATFFGYTSDSQFGSYVASLDLYNLYESTDIRKQLFTNHPLTTEVNLQAEVLDYYFTKKFQGNPGYVAFRLSEQYLIRAEAALKLDNIDQAKTDINTIRERAKASLLSDVENLEEAIFLERRKEMCFEGHFFFDIARKHKDTNRNDGCISRNCDISYPSSKYILPIPRNNTNLNANLKQNESYY
jgi:starch-binding outer membrane protein, SusD/RagB family